MGEIATSGRRPRADEPRAHLERSRGVASHGRTPRRGQWKAALAGLERERVAAGGWAAATGPVEILTAMRRPPLLEERPRSGRLVLVVVIPAAYGAITGYLLGVSAGAYTALALIGIVGVFGAGFEHRGARAGALRGAIAGSVFGAAVLITHAIHGASAKASLPKPHIVLIVIAAAVSAAFGALGGRARERAERREQPSVDAPSTPPEPVPAPPRVQPGPPTAASPAAPASVADGHVSLSSGNFDEFRALGMSVTQAKRLIAYREQLGGYSTVDDLDQVPGFSQAFRADLKQRLLA
jgi:DNA uptake protein ComE-like DNA-binding protein